MKKILTLLISSVYCFAAYYQSDKSYEDIAKTNTQKAEQMCIDNDKKMCHILAFMYQGGLGLPKNDEKSLQFAVKGCILGDEFCCEGVNYLTNLKKQEQYKNTYNSDDITSKNTYDPYNTYYVRNGKRYMLPSTCPMGADKDTAYMYAIEYLKVGNAKEAKRCLEKGCDKKYSPLAKSCTKLGDMHYSGNGAMFSYEEALRYYKRGCELGDSNACLGTKKVAEAIKYEQRLNDKNKYEVIIKKQNNSQEGYNPYSPYGKDIDNILLEKRQKFGL